MQNVVFISGSLRKHSWNTKLLQAFAAEMGDNVAVEWLSIDWPLLNEDLEAEAFPSVVQDAKDTIATADTIIIATPEYNRGMTGVLKNALDWLSRPYGKNSLAGKRVMVFSASLGGVAGACAYYQVVQTLTHLSAIVQTDTEFMVGHVADKFAEDGTLQDESTKSFIQDALQKLST